MAESLTDITNIWAEMLADTTLLEDEFQKFLERYPAFLPGGRGDIGSGGHHGPHLNAIFKQPPLTGLGASARVPDFMWIVTSTTDITVVCIEIERPSKLWFTSTGGQRAEFTQAHNQLLQWKNWFADEGRRKSFRSAYGIDQRWPNLDMTVEYVLIYGRQEEFVDPAVGLPSAERLRLRNTMARPHEHLRTFDSLVWDDLLRNVVTVQPHANGTFEVTSIPSWFEGSGRPGAAHVLGSIDDALENGSAETQERADEIRALWAKDQEVGRRLDAGLTARPSRIAGNWGRDSL